MTSNNITSGKSLEVSEILTADNYHPSKIIPTTCNDANHELNNQIDAVCSSIEEWDCNLLMDCTHHGVMSKSVNILTVTTKEFKNMETQNYFCRDTYPSDEGFKSEGWKDLKRKLQDSAREAGYSILCSGGGDKRYTKQWRIFRCKHGIKYRPRRNKEDRPGIKRRKSSSKRPIDNKNLCKFFFYIGCDSNGFFIRNGYGNLKHNGHPFMQTSNMNSISQHLTDIKSQIQSQTSLIRAQTILTKMEFILSNWDTYILNYDTPVRSILKQIIQSFALGHGFDVTTLDQAGIAEKVKILIGHEPRIGQYIDGKTYIYYS